MEWYSFIIVSFIFFSFSRVSRFRFFFVSFRFSLVIRFLDLFRARFNFSFVRFFLDLLRDFFSFRRVSRFLDRFRRRVCFIFMFRLSFFVGVRGRNLYFFFKEGRYNRGFGERDRRLRRRLFKELVSVVILVFVVIKEYIGIIFVIFYD